MLPKIPVIDLGRDGFAPLVAMHRGRLDDILASARRQYSRPLLALGDRVCRRWADGTALLPYRDELEDITAAIGATGGWLLNFSYEWGCTCGVAAAPDGAPRLMRSLDWQLPGLGRTLVAAWRDASAGRWLNLTWPGFIGTVQGLAPGRFAVAINQAPGADTGWGRPGDWLASRIAVWRHRQSPPVLALRRAFDECRDFAAACDFLAGVPLCAPVIFTVAGCRPGDAAVIERLPDRAIIHRDAAAVTNHWLTTTLPGRSHSFETAARLTAMRRHLAARTPLSPAFAWLSPPILNPETRLVMEATPATGDLAAQGFEGETAATAVLTIKA
ncbi:MAG: hypothetical protein GC191_14375 [Azospirillum sp.]|nr:hypothetical protein [Azospirillum sp.]